MFALGGMDSKAALPQLKRLAKTDHFGGILGWKNSEEAKDTIEIINNDRFPEPDAFHRLGNNPPKPDYKWPWSF